MSSTKEIEHLERIASDSWYARGCNRRTIEYSFKIFTRHIHGETILELGPAEGVMTDMLASLGKRLTLVEGSSKFCDDLRHRHPKAKVVHSLFEDFQTEDRFDNIVLGHVLEHVADPIEILKLAKTWLSAEGRILAAVPNARSIHRQAAVLMGLLPFEEAMNEADHHHGHRRVFTPETFRSAFLQAGLEIEIFGGYWLKPVSNRQIEETWTPEMLTAFMQLGERYPDISGEIYVVAQLKKGGQK
jgi:2-polyprenyl-3-methyl-5-hydroxy-6-metoxy-1,4-benzoquinol methylase